MTILAIDTAANLCAACIWDADGERGRSVADIGKGHAEQLMTTIAEALERAGVGYGDLTAVAVAVGPGSFTGVRVGVAAARGLALALAVPCAGVTTLEAIAAETRNAEPDVPVLAAIDARRDEVYAALFDASGDVVTAPAAMSFAEAASLVGDEAVRVAGSGAAQVLEVAGRGRQASNGGATADIAVYASLAASRPFPAQKPKPFYLRGADAKPQAGFALARKPV